MLAISVSPLRNTTDGTEGDTESFFAGDDDFSDFSAGNFLYSIDFDDLFVGFNDGDDLLPDLEMDSVMLAEFSTSGGEESATNASVSAEKVGSLRKEEEDKLSSGSGFGSGFGLNQGEESVSKREKSASASASASAAANPSQKEVEKGRKSSAQSKTHHGKRKVKVDWTPELHRRFVQAVELLGVDKAVPSKILEIMGIDFLNRHNIASHLQKYRLHRKHLQARRAETASRSRRRQMCGGAAGGGSNKNVNPWVAPTMGFPPMTVPLQHFRPLHVWGHRSTDQLLMHMWPKYLIRPPAVEAAWAPTPHPPPPRPPQDAPFWHPHPQRVHPNPITQGTPYFPPPLASPRFPAPPLVPGFLSHHPMYRVNPSVGFPTRQRSQAGPHRPSDFHPSKESIDSAIGDVLSKPWLPPPLGLKPPSLDSVLVELQRQGIPKIPTSCG